MILPVFIALLVVTFVWLYFKLQYKDPALLAIPSFAKLVPIFGNILSLDPRNFNDTVCKYFEKTNAKIAVLWIFSRPLIFIADATLAGELMRDTKYMRQGEPFDIFYRTMGDVIFSIDGPNWKERRTRLNHSFGPLKVRNLFPIIQEKGAKMIEIIHSVMEKQGFVDVDELFIKATADIIMLFTMSKDYQVMTSDPHKIDYYFELVRDEGFTSAAIPFWKYLPAPSRIRFFLQRRKFHQFLDKETLERVEFRKKNPGAPINDALDVLVDKGVSLAEIRVELVGLLFAGHDTTSHTAAFALLELSKPENKRVFDKLMEEIDSVIPNSNGIIKITHADDVQKLVYLSAVIKETLRLYPIGVSHPVEAQEDVEIEGYRIPKGNVVFIHYYSTQRLSKYWKDPLTFDPDRWLDNSPSSTIEALTSSGQLSNVYMPFLSGPHVCIGQHLAQLEMKILLAMLLKNISFSLKPGYTPYAGNKITLCPLPGAHLVAKKRK